jgi:hypothetical protein
MHAIVIHGMGRTPLSMAILAYRLSRKGYRVHLFPYTVTFESLATCLNRLVGFVDQRVNSEDYFVVAHSLGTVLTRLLIPQIKKKPSACFFLAPPAKACYAAKSLSGKRWYRLLTGEMGQALADDAFMSTLPIPECPTKVYSGIAGYTGKFSPYNEANDGVLMVTETIIDGVPYQEVAELHTFIMNSKPVFYDIIVNLSDL